MITPFPVDDVNHSVRKTYLDTSGRHMVTLKKARCTENHAQLVYVSLSSVLQPFSIKLAHFLSEFSRWEGC